MKTKRDLNPPKQWITYLSLLATTLLALLGPVVASAQGTVTFDYPWATGGFGGLSLYPDASGMSVEIGYRIPPFDDPVRVGAEFAGHPSNGTPHAEFNVAGSPQFTVFALTNAASQGHWFSNGAPIGLVSVDLADPVAPSLTPVSITFNGFRANGSMVSQTFTTPGSGSSFQTYYFDSDFLSGLVRLEVPSSVWAMDNLVFTVPEPGVGSLLLLGLLALWRAGGGRRC
jgi:hypothetical protein